MTPSRRLRVVLVDDSALALKVLQRVLAETDDIEVAGAATDGRTALELVQQHQPDVVCTDYHMPGMNGVEFIRAVMASSPRPILVVTASLVGPEAPKMIASLAAGAVDVVRKPMLGARSTDPSGSELVQAIRRASRVSLGARRATLAPAVAPAGRPAVTPVARGGLRVLGVGASTGGPQALQTVLGALPASFPVPVLCVQHIGASFLPMFADWLRSVCRLKVVLAQGGELPQAGTVYLSPGDLHLRLEAGGRLGLSAAEPVRSHRPSVDVLFDSLAAAAGRAATAVLLTGMGSDGALGMQAIHRAGGVTIAQDEATSLVFGMPRQAIELQAATHVLPLGDIAPTLGALFR